MSGEDKKPKDSAARKRTVRRMRRLLATSAALGLGCSSGIEGGQTPEPPLVCDPLPPPLECEEGLSTAYLARFVVWRASWNLGGVAQAVDVDLRISNYGDGDSLAFSGEPQLEGAALGSVERTNRLLLFSCFPEERREGVALTVPLDCGGLAAELRLSLDVSGERRDGADVPIEIRE